MLQADSLVGATLGGRYRIESLLGAGGFSVVYRGVHVTLGRPVAVKVLREKSDARPDLQRSRFEREAKTLATLSHPNVVGVVDFGVEEDLPYLVLEMVEGESLRALVDRGPIDSNRALRIARQILRGLGYAHAKGVMHRDLKPTNIELAAMPGGEDQVKILDFGFAKLFGAAARGNEPKLTEVGKTFGTPEYMAPEQASGQPTDGRADLYALGIILFEMIAGRRPFEGAPMEVLRAHLLEPPPRLRALRPDLAVPQSIDDAILRAMSKDPAGRFASAEAMLAALDDPTTEIVVAEAVPPRPAPLRVQEPTTEIVLAEEVVTEPPAVPRVPVAVPAPRSPRPVLVSPAAPAPPIPQVPLPTYVAAPPVFLPEPAPPAAAAPPPIEPAKPAPAPAVAVERPPADASAPTVAAPPVSAAPTARRPGDLVVFGGGLLVLVTVVALVSAGGDHEDRREPSTARPAKRAAEAPARPLDPHAPRDPWSAPVPDALRDLATKIRGGERMDAASLLPLGRYSRAHPGDPRPHLLLAYAYGDMQWSADAVRRYAAAFRADPSSRGDPRMLPDLVRLVTSRSVGDEAASAIRTIYGEEALPALDRAIEAARDRPAEAARLERLAQRIRSH